MCSPATETRKKVQILPFNWIFIKLAEYLFKYTQGKVCRYDFIRAHILSIPSVYVRIRIEYPNTNIWPKLFKNGPNKIFKGCLPQVLLDPFLNK